MFSCIIDHVDLERTYPETDDEGIEKDSGDCDDDTRRTTNDQHISLDRVIEVSSNNNDIVR